MAKYIMLIIGLVIMPTAKAQTEFVLDSLSITKVIPFQKKMSYGHYEVKFKKVLSDSRCPKNVMCIRAGEAKVLLSIYNKGEFISDREITIHASGYVMEETNLAFDTEDFKIYGMTLKPYPKTSNSIPETDYTLDIAFQPKRL